jgi:hypothetical protein
MEIKSFKIKSFKDKKQMTKKVKKYKRKQKNKSITTDIFIFFKKLFY